MESMNPVRGNVVRLYYNDNEEKTRGSLQNFYDLMWCEASALSIDKPGVHTQVPNVYYWRGAAVTHSASADEQYPGFCIELQKDGDMNGLNKLVNRLADEMGVTFNQKVVSREEWERKE